MRPVHGQPAVFQIQNIRAFDGVQTNDSNGHFFLFVRVLSLHGSNLGKKRKESKANPPDSLSIFGLKLKSLGHLVENLKNISFKIAHSSSSRSKCLSKRHADRVAVVCNLAVWTLELKAIEHFKKIMSKRFPVLQLGISKLKLSLRHITGT